MLIVVQNTSLPIDRRVWLEATTLVAAGYEVHGICPKLNGQRRSCETIDGVTVHRYRLPVDARGPLGFVLETLWCVLRSTLLVARIGFRPGFDVLHLCNPPEAYWPLAMAARWCGKSVVFDHHDLSPEMFSAKFGDGHRFVLSLLERCERLTFRFADVVLATNESYRDVAIERGGKAPGDVFVVRSGPPVARLARYPADPAHRHRRRHLIGYVGEICPQDGVEHLVRALRILRDDLGRDDFHCVVIGTGPHQPAIKAYAAELGVADRCTFTGWVSEEDWCRLLSSVDVGVEPNPLSAWSDRSTMNKVLDYMYFGLPIVAYDLKENRRSAGPAAVYAAPDDEADLAAHIDALLDDEPRRRAMGELGRARLEGELSWEHSAPVLLQAYAQLADRRSPATAEAMKGGAWTSTSP